MGSTALKKASISLNVHFLVSNAVCLAENCPLSNLQLSGGPIIERAVSTASLAATSASSPDSDHMKRISYSEMALNKPSLSQPLLTGGSPYSSFGSNSNPKLMSRSHQNLGQVPESPESQAQLYSNQSQMNLKQPPVPSSHHRASSDTESITVARKQQGCVAQFCLYGFLYYGFVYTALTSCFVV